MKKLFTLLSLCLLLGVGILNAQNQRTVVLECFTSATCGPCASINPSLDNLINNNVDKLIAIKYHVNWPVDNDPMNHHNPGEVSSKVSYYGVNSVPMSVGDGTWMGNSGSVNQNLINQWAAVESPLEMRMTHYLNATQDSIFVIVMGRATTAIPSENLKLNIAVLEKTMEYASAPGSNGERIFHNVMKKMLPGASGTSISAMRPGDYFAYKYSWALANVMDVNELTAVAWLQDHSTKQVYQGCKSSESFEPYFAKQAKISSIDHTKKFICSGTVTPDIIVDNFGSETINSLVINVSLNGNEVKTMTWQGNVETGKSVKITLDELNFDTDAQNEMLIAIDQINGAGDDYWPSVYAYTFEEAKCVVNKSFKLSIRTDNDPQSTTWDIVNTTTNEIVLSGGPYDEPNKMYNEEFDLEGDGCYMFTIYDADGNGLSNGNGIYGLKAGSTTLFSGGRFTDKESTEFSFEKYDEIAENQANTLKIYPNPSSGVVTVDADNDGNLMVYNTAGQMVFNQPIYNKTVVNVSNLEKGTYLFVLTDNWGNSSRQVIVLQ